MVDEPELIGFPDFRSRATRPCAARSTSHAHHAQAFQNSYFGGGFTSCVVLYWDSGWLPRHRTRSHSSLNLDHLQPKVQAAKSSLQSPYDALATDGQSSKDISLKVCHLQRIPLQPESISSQTLEVELGVQDYWAMCSQGCKSQSSALPNCNK